MYQFLFIAIISYIIGSIIKVANGSRRYSLEFAKGFLILLISGIYLHSGLSYLMASVGVLAGQSRPLFSKANGSSTEVVALGIMFFMSPAIGIVLLLIFVIFYMILKDYNRAVFAASLTIPVIAFKSFRSDSYIIISMIIFASLLIQFGLPFLEKKMKPKLLYDIGVGLGVLGFLILLYFNKYVYRGFGLQTDIIRHGTHHFKYVALTFDDGPDPVYTPEILDILKEKDVRATFFLVGKNVNSYPEIAKRIVEEGHSIGNHTYSHRSLIPLTAKSTYKEVKDAETAIDEATGVRPTLFRPPRGVYSNYVRGLLKEEGYTLVLW
ncbi:MAG: glycerol-3-phosphate acyltransferase, partial [Tepidanaerobacteraceae bacterium]